MKRWLLLAALVAAPPGAAAAEEWRLLDSTITCYRSPVTERCQSQAIFEAPAGERTLCTLQVWLASEREPQSQPRSQSNLACTPTTAQQVQDRGGRQLAPLADDPPQSVEDGTVVWRLQDGKAVGCAAPYGKYLVCATP